MHRDDKLKKEKKIERKNKIQHGKFMKVHCYISGVNRCEIVLFLPEFIYGCDCADDGLVEMKT